MTNETTYTVYALVNRATGEKGYIGVSTSPVRRWQEHLSTAHGGRDTPLGHWIRAVEAAGARVVLEILEEEIPQSKAAIAEARWVVKAVENGDPIQNNSARINPGKPTGIGRSRLSEEERKVPVRLWFTAAEREEIFRRGGPEYVSRKIQEYIEREARGPLE